MNDQLRPFDSSSDPSVKAKIDAICDRFEAAWRQDVQLRIEPFLRGFSETLPCGAMEELVLQEIDLRNSGGQSLDRFEYYDRFPGYRDAVNAGFARLPQEVDVLLASMTREESDHDDSFMLNVAGQTQVPDQIGHYRVEQRVDGGSFGIVYRAVDGRTGETVALKFPRQRTITDAQQLKEFVDEAVAASQLDHPGIVKTYGVEHKYGLVFIIQQFIDGGTLQDVVRARPEQKRAAQLVASIAQAAAHAHQQGFVHRDLKPSNILLDRQGNPYIADFGLAVHEDFQGRIKGQIGGAPAYMSPEQAEGLGHFLDGRSDIWSIGVMLYELLLGRRPFKGDTRADLFAAIRFQEAKPPQQIDPDVDPELQRICLCCLEKAVRDRYLTASDLADDLHRWLSDPAPAARPTEPDRIVPQGLRSFGADDKDFFLQLLPGPRDRFGIPASVRFWKSRIESTAPETTFSIGVIYGPSGSGKSSFVNAGLLPRIAAHVVPIYIEATARDTEVRLLRRLRQEFPEIPQDDQLGVPDIFHGLREEMWRSAGKKLLIVFDQFEQWLFANKLDPDSQLVRAMRHCDGKHLQALVLVRDDFWLATSRLMNALEVELVDGHNAQMVDLFDRQHARNVLTRFGQAYDRLPQQTGDLSVDQENFLDQAIEGLAVDERIICVRLTLFAELLKNRPWTPAALKSVGGIAGVGETFLEETFGERTASAPLRPHFKAVQAVLGALLPAAGTDIKGHMRSCQTLRDASGYAQRRERFDELVKILDADLKLITPTDPDAVDSSPIKSPSGSAEHYQLTHDYLVPSIRNWLSRKQRETWQGRAQIQLAELEAEYSSSGDRRHLPRLIQYVQMCMAVPKAKRTTNGRALLAAATGYYMFHGAWLAILLSTIAAVSFVAWRNSNSRSARQATIRVLDCRPGELDGALEQLRQYQSVAQPYLLAALDDPDARKRIHACCAILRLYPNQDSIVPVLIDLMASADEREGKNIIGALSHYRQPAVTHLSSLVENAESDAARVRLVAVLLSLGEPRHAATLLAGIEYPDRGTLLIDAFDQWHDDLQIVVNAIESIDTPSFQYGMVVALASVDHRYVSADDRRRCERFFSTLIETTADPGVRSACQHAAQKWDLLLRSAAVDDAPQKRWFDIEFFENCRVRFVRIDSGVLKRGEGAKSADPEYPPAEVPIERFWMADTETPFEMIRPWVLSLEHSSPRRAELEKQLLWTNTGTNLPAFTITADEAVEFVNWLSVKHGREPCYEPRNDPVESEQKWFFVPGRNGFRLPTPDEWEWACRAGSRTRFFWGDVGSQRIVQRYAALNEIVYLQGGNPVSSMAQLAPNRWGLFDMTGNISEICRDQRGTEIFIRGGNSTSGLYDLISASADVRPGAFSDKRYAPFEGLRLVTGVLFPEGSVP